MKKRYILLIILAMISLQSCSLLKKEESKNKMYYEKLDIRTTTHDENLFYTLSIAANKKLDLKSKDLLTTSIDNKKVKLESVKIEEVDTIEDKIHSYKILYNLTVPKEKVVYNIQTKIKDFDRVIELKDCKNEYFPGNSPSKYEKTLTSFLTGDGDKIISTEIVLPDKNVKELEFGIVDKGVKEIEIVDDHKVIIKSQTKMPTIEGYYFIDGGVKTSIGNTYFVNLMDKSNSNLMNYFKQK